MFLRHLALLPLLVGLAVPAFAAEVRPLTEWKFKKLGKDASPETETVTIPHTWNASDATANKFYRGPAVYTRDLGPGGVFAGKRVFLRCEAVSIMTEIVLNGKRVGEHRGAFSEFGF